MRPELDAVLGRRDGTDEPVLLNLNDQDNGHLTVLGCSGSGKTNSLSVLIDALLQGAVALIVVDVKGGGLENWCVERAVLYERPARALSLSSLGFTYDPLRDGAPSQVADKLAGAFDESRNGEIYRLIGQRILSLVVRALRALQKDVTFEALIQSLNPARLPGLAHDIRREDNATAVELIELAAASGVTASAMEGMRARLGAFVDGLYGPYLANQGKPLSMTSAVMQPGLTYVALPALASARDTRLMGRMIIQDLKQAIHARLGGSSDLHAVIMIDEFAALDDPLQILDLLRQSREAGVNVVLSSQGLPAGDRGSLLRGALLGSGSLLIHRLHRDDAEAVSRSSGEVRTIEATKTFRQGQPTSVAARPRRIPRVDASAILTLARGDAFLLQPSRGAPPVRVRVSAAPTGAAP